MNELLRNAEGYCDPTASAALLTIEREDRSQRLGYMPLVYICSPYAGDIEQNVQNARRYCAFALTQKTLPIAPHLLFPQFLGAEETEESRELALHMGLILLCHCREVWFFGDTVSEGMKKELNRARWRNMVVRHFTDDCTEVQI
ncbi:MAG TPA: DUF4406 domain-containing protein [Clostridia bacterium]|nr:DUF4406 domain-containing protein [Clostridia bacterium]